MSGFKVMLLCGSRFALPTMQLLLYQQQLSVVCIPEHCTEFREQVSILLRHTKVPVQVIEKNNCDQLLSTAIKEYAIDICLMATFSFRIPASVYALPAKGFYNLHPGPLPQYRGSDPVFQQIKNREKYAAVTLHTIDAGLDTGEIVMKEMIPLLETDTYGMLTTKLAGVASKLVGVLLQVASFGTSVPAKKQDESQARYYPRQGAAEVTIQWETMDAPAIMALVNACNPWNKGAVTKIGHSIIRILEVACMALPEQPKAAPGTILSFEEDGFIVSAMHDTALSVHYLYMDEGFLPAGKLSGFGFAAGNRFELPG